MHCSLWFTPTTCTSITYINLIWKDFKKYLWNIVFTNVLKSHALLNCLDLMHFLMSWHVYRRLKCIPIGGLVWIFIYLLNVRAKRGEGLPWCILYFIGDKNGMLQQIRTNKENNFTYTSNPYKRTWFFSHKSCNSWHMWGKLCGFIHYNVHYVMFIVAYITLKMQYDIKSWHILCKECGFCLRKNVDFQLSCSNLKWRW
jgi:hypothetical protein